MDLANPWGLLALLGIPLVVLLHRRSARTRRVVPLVTLWRPAAARARSGARPLRDPLLLVRLLVVTGVALALAQPGWPGAPALRHVLVLDASASMSTREGRTTRFREAQDEAARVLAALPSGSDVLVVRAGAPPAVAHAWSRDRRSVGAVVDALAPGEAPKDLRSALALAGAGLEGRSGRAHLFSDFGGDLMSLARQAGLAPTALAFHPVGSPAENLAIVRAGVAAHARSPLDSEVFALVANFADRTRSVDVALSRSDGGLERQRLTLAPGERMPAFFTVPASDWLELRLEGAPDALPADDRVTLVPSPRRLRVLHVGGADPFVAAALRAHPGLEITRMAPERFEAAQWSSAGVDVAVLEGAAPPPGFSVPTLVLGAPSGRHGRSAPVMSWDRHHPLLRGIDLHGVAVPAGRTLPSAAGAALISCAEGPVAAAALRDDRRRVELSFAVVDSTLGYASAFPILFSRSIDWLAERGSSGANLEAGQPLEIPSPGRVDSGLTVRRPDGSLMPAQVENGRLRFSRTELVGRYLITGLGIEIPFSVNLLNADESDVRRPPSRPSPGPVVVAEHRGDPTDRRSAARFALAAALPLLSVEIWLVQRRAARQRT